MRHGTLDLLENVEERGGDNKPSSLCDSCKAVRLASLLSDGGHLLHPNWASLENAAGACDPCRVILSHLLEAVREKLSHEDDEDNNTLVGGGIPDKLWHQRGLSTPIVLRYAPDYDPEVVAGRPRRLRLKPRDTSNIWATCGRFKANEANPTDDNSLQCHTRRRTKPDQEFYVSVLVPTHVYQDNPLRRLGIQVRRPLAPSALDEGVVSMVKGWVKHCSTTHAECRSEFNANAERTYPTRLLDLRDVDETGALRVVVVTDDFHEEYVALSYCWGSKHREWTGYVKERQRRGASAAMTQVLMSRMPQTLQDAVTTSAALGYFYLWIDCLCILQGNKTDWLEEGAKMCDIYANAVLTISASDSSDSRDGFLGGGRPRSRLQREGAILPLLPRGIDEGTGDNSFVHLLPPGTDFSTLVGQGPVARRAWCLQERQLAPRVLHVCGRGEVSFECVKCRRFESEVVPDDEYDLDDEWYKFHIPKDVFDLSIGKPSPKLHNVLSWYAIVEDYTRRGLAVPGDKLVAIAGLAQRAQEQTRLGEADYGRYLAGLWSRQIHIGLAWMAEVEQNLVSYHGATTRATAPTTRVRGTYRAPSWSWASMDGPINWGLTDGWVQSEDGFLESAIRLVDSSVVLLAAGSDGPFGPVQYAEIVVTGQVKRIPVSELLANRILTYPIWMSGASTHIGFYVEDEKNILHGGEDEALICLKIAVRPFGPGPSIPPTNQMLILEKVEEEGETSGNQNSNKYKRVGFGEVLETAYFDNCPMTTLTLV